MSLFGGRSRREFTGLSPEELIASSGRNAGLGNRWGPGSVNADTALRHSAVWACKRLRADLVSTFPVDQFRKHGSIDLEVPAKPPILVDPGGRDWPWHHWVWASQADLDGVGNSIGVITERHPIASPRHPKGLPARIDLQPSRSVSVRFTKAKGWMYRIDNSEFAPDDIWHERQFPVPGTPIGLSPIAYAAWTISEHLSIQAFALDWFAGGAVPKARMRNTKKTLTGPQIDQAKQWYRDVIQNGDLLVTGSDWEYDMIQAEQAGSEWLDARRYGLADVCRFMGCPADLIEAAISAPGSITYQSSLQRNMQFLVMHLGATVYRREQSWSTLLPAPRFVKLNVDALLRMDPETRAKVIGEQIASRVLTLTEARELENRPPLTAEQVAEFIDVFGDPKAKPPVAAKPAAPA